MYLCPKATDTEIGLFLRVCRETKLNPFTREIYLIKYSDNEPASIVIAIDSFLKAAETNDQYDGHEAGIVLKQGGQLVFREGTIMLPEESENLVGGYAKVFRKDRSKPFYTAVNLVEYMKFKRDGDPTRFWKEMPATMIRNVALRHSMKEAFPNRFTNVFVEGEVPEQEEGSFPEAFVVNGLNNWRKWWARQKEKGLNYEEIHKALGISSIKNDWIDKGKTLEDAEKAVNEYLKNKANQPIEGTVVSDPAEPGKTEETHTSEPQAAAQPKAEQKPAPAKKTPKERTKENVNSIGALYTAASEDFGLKTRKAVLDELNLTSQELIADPWDCYVKLKGIHSQVA